MDNLSKDFLEFFQTATGRYLFLLYTFIMVLRNAKKKK